MKMLFFRNVQLCNKYVRIEASVALKEREKVTCGTIMYCK